MLQLSVSKFNASEGDVITKTVSVSKDSNIASLKKTLNYKDLAEIQIFHQARLLDDEDKIQECLEDGDELNAVVADGDQRKTSKADTTNHSSKKVIIVYQRNKFLNLEVGQRKNLRVKSSFLWGTFCVLRELDVLEDNELVYQGFKYNLPEDTKIQEMQITENHVIKIMKKDSSRVVLPPLGEPIKIKREELSKEKKKVFLVDNEGPEIYLLTGTKTSFNPYHLDANSKNSLKILESKRFKLFSGTQFHFGLCKKAVETKVGAEYTAYMYDAIQVQNPQKIIIRNSGDGEGPNVVLINEQGGENVQKAQDLPQKIFTSNDRKRFDDWLKLGAEVGGQASKVAGALVGGVAP